MAIADRELLNIRARARRQSLEQRIIRCVASSTVIETRQLISQIEAMLRTSEQLLINHRPVTLA